MLNIVFEVIVQGALVVVVVGVEWRMRSVKALEYARQEVGE